MNIYFYSFTLPSILCLLPFLWCVFSLFFRISFSSWLLFIFVFFLFLWHILHHVLSSSFSFTSCSSSNMFTSFQIESDDSTLIIHIYDILSNVIFRNSCLPFFCYQYAMFVLSSLWTVSVEISSKLFLCMYEEIIVCPYLFDSNSFVGARIFLKDFSVLLFLYIEILKIDAFWENYE